MLLHHSGDYPSISRGVLDCKCVIIPYTFVMTVVSICEYYVVPCLLSEVYSVCTSFRILALHRSVGARATSRKVAGSIPDEVIRFLS
jgi:hypothetical protein